MPKIYLFCLFRFDRNFGFLVYDFDFLFFCFWISGCLDALPGCWDASRSRRYDLLDASSWSWLNARSQPASQDRRPSQHSRHAGTQARQLLSYRCTHSTQRSSQLSSGWEKAPSYLLPCPRAACAAVPLVVLCVAQASSVSTQQLNQGAFDQSSTVIN